MTVARRDAGGLAASLFVAAIGSLVPGSLGASQSGGDAQGPAKLEREAAAAERRGDHVAALALYEQWLRDPERYSSDTSDTYNRVIYRLEALADLFAREGADAARQGDRARGLQLYAHARRAASHLGANYEPQDEIEKRMMRLVGESGDWPPLPRAAAELAEAATAQLRSATTASTLFDAIQTLREAVDLAPWDARLWFNLALLREAEGDVGFATEPAGASGDYLGAIGALELYALAVPKDGAEIQRRIAALKDKRLTAQERECRLYQYGSLSCWGAAEEHARRGNFQEAATYLDVGCRVRQMDQMCAGGEIRRKILGK